MFMLSKLCSMTKSLTRPPDPIEDGSWSYPLMEEPPDAPKSKRLHKSIVAPGLVDTHIHGYKVS